jgi:hypothetical protein
MGGPTVWGLGEVLTTPLRKKYLLRTPQKGESLPREKKKAGGNHPPPADGGGGGGVSGGSTTL